MFSLLATVTDYSTLRFSLIVGHSPPTTQMIDDPELADGNGHRSSVRYQVLVLAVALAALTDVDRGCIVQPAPAMMRDLSLTEVQMGFVFSAFTITYAVFEMPSGAWGDRIGSRGILQLSRFPN